MDEKKLIEQQIFNDTSKYQDIMNLPYHVSKRHLPMAQIDRAAQFAPFSALDGFNSLIKEKTKDYTHKKYSTADDERKIMHQLHYLQNNPVKVDVNYFNDESGYYEHLKGYLQKIEPQKGRVSFNEISIVIVNIRQIKIDKHNK